MYMQNLKTKQMNKPNELIDTENKLIGVRGEGCWVKKVKGLKGTKLTVTKQSWTYKVQHK